MKIGYPCINNGLASRSSHTFRLASYSEARLRETIELNLAGLEDILLFNAESNLLFLRIASTIIPFASHPVCTVDWQTRYAKDFKRLGEFIKQQNFRISMHPDQFTLINSPSEEIFGRSVAELVYHAQVLELLGTNTTAKIQIHIGGVYGDKEGSMKRFIERFGMLPKKVQERLVIENDDRLYSVMDCLHISEHTGIPVLFDSLHHEILNNGETMHDALASVQKTWKLSDGIPLIDYSQQEKGARIGNHAKSIDTTEFTKFLQLVAAIDFDCMFEIKDKEITALKALHVLKELHYPTFIQAIQK